MKTKIKLKNKSIHKDDELLPITVDAKCPHCKKIVNMYLKNMDYKRLTDCTECHKGIVIYSTYNVNIDIVIDIKKVV